MFALSLEDEKELEKDTESINELSDASEEVGDIRDNLKNKEEISETAAKVVSVSIENIKKRLGIVNYRPIPSVESFTNKHTKKQALKVSMEGLKEFLKKIWDSICNFFKKIWEWISKLWSNPKKDEETADTITEDVKDTVEKVKSGEIEIVKTEVTEIEDAYITDVFGDHKNSFEELTKFVDYNYKFIKEEIANIGDFASVVLSASTSLKLEMMEFKKQNKDLSKNEYLFNKDILNIKNILLDKQAEICGNKIEKKNNGNDGWVESVSSNPLFNNRVYTFQCDRKLYTKDAKEDSLDRVPKAILTFKITSDTNKSTDNKTIKLLKKEELVLMGNYTNNFNIMFKELLSKKNVLDKIEKSLENIIKEFNGVVTNEEEDIYADFIKAGGNILTSMQCLNKLIFADLKIHIQKFLNASKKLVDITVQNTAKEEPKKEPEAKTKQSKKR